MSAWAWLALALAAFCAVTAWLALAAFCAVTAWLALLLFAFAKFTPAAPVPFRTPWPAEEEVGHN